MKFTVNRNLLLQAMQHTCIQMSKNSIWFWANHFMMSIQDKTLFITGASPGEKISEVLITETVMLEYEPTDLSIHAAPFFVHKSILRAIKTLEEQPLELTVGEYQLTVKHQQGFFRVPLSDISFPETKTLQTEGLTRIKMEAPGLYSCLSKVAFAAADDELRPALSGVFVEVELNQVNFVASNSHILMCLRKTCSEPNNSCCSFIMPHYVAKIILRVLPKTGYCELSYSSGLASLKIDNNLQVTFPSIDSRYPSYKKVIPTEGFCTTFSIYKRTLLKSLNRLYLFSGYSSQGVKFSLSEQEPGLLTLKSECLDENSIGQEKITCDVIDGVSKFDNGLLFKIPLLAAILNHVPAEKITFMATGSNTACLMSFEPLPDVETLTALIMPMMQCDDD